MSTISSTTVTTTVYDHSVKTSPGKGSSLSVASSSATIGRDIYRQFVTYPQDVSIPSIRDLATRSLVGRIRVRLRLWRISSRIRKSQNIPDQFYEDLIELQRPSAYSSAVSSKAWNLLIKQIVPSSIRAIVDILLTFSRQDVVSLLSRLALLDDMRTPWRGSKPSLFCLIFRELQRRTDGLDVVNSGFTLTSVASLLTRRHQVQSNLPIHRFLDALIKSISSSSDVFSVLQDWDMPLAGQCFLQFILTSPHNKDHTHFMVDYIMACIHAFVPRLSSELYRTVVLNNHPSLLEMRSSLVVSDMHPMLPFIRFASHLAFHSSLATDLFIETGVLHIISKLWLYGIPSPNAVSPLNSPDDWKVFSAGKNNDMRVACLLLLGAFIRHRPTIWEFVDYLLYMQINVFCVPTIDARFPEMYPEDWTKHTVIPPLSLFLTEACVANGVKINGNVTGVIGRSWTHAMNLLSVQATSKGAIQAKDIAVRILLSCASTSEEHWRPVIEFFYSWQYTRIFKAFSYIINDYLRATASDIYADHFTLPGSTVTFLQRLHANAKTRGSEVTNPIDRFIMLTRQIATSCRPYALALRDAGMPDLLKAVLDGRYDKFFTEERELPPTPSDDSTIADENSVHSIHSSTLSRSHSTPVKRTPFQVRARVCNQMLLELESTNMMDKCTYSEHALPGEANGRSS